MCFISFTDFFPLLQANEDCSRIFSDCLKKEKWVLTYKMFRLKNIVERLKHWQTEVIFNVLWYLLFICTSLLKYLNPAVFKILIPYKWILSKFVFVEIRIPNLYIIVLLPITFSCKSTLFWEKLSSPDILENAL